MKESSEESQKREHELRYKGFDTADRMLSDMERYTQEKEQEKASSKQKDQEEEKRQEDRKEQVKKTKQIEQELREA